MDGLTDAQAEAVQHTDGPLLVLAGAGSGKTRVITRRAAYLARMVARADEILAITFTNKAAGEMRERITALGVGRHMWICTFHALCARLLRTYAAEVGLQGNFTIFDQADSRALVKQAISKSDLNADNWSPRAMQERISQAKQNLKTPSEYASTEAYDFSGKAVAKIYEHYQSMLEDQNACDFDDLLMRTARLLEDNKGVRLALSDRFRYLLIDEYQDTNHAQYLIATHLARAHRNLCATGDPDQSIYAWRGADLQNILDFEADYEDAKVVRLEQNFRSSGAILSAASELISHNEHRKHKKLWTTDEFGASVELWTCESANIEAEKIAEAIEQYISEGGQPGDVAIFYRINALSRVAEDALRRKHIPYQIARGVEFYARKEIKDTLSYLRLISNPADETALMRAINTPTRGIGKVTLERVADYARVNGITVDAAVQAAETISTLKTARKKVGAFAELIRGLRDLPERPVKRIVQAVIERSGLEAEFNKQGGEIENDALDNVYELVNAAGDYDLENPEGSLTEWLQQISLVSDQDMIDDERGAVTLMTLHAAKGLEFPIVFMIGLEEGMLPHQRAAEDRLGGIEEERRLAFVGMTRAMKRLTLSWAMYRMVRGVTERTLMSHFLGQLPEDEIVTREFVDEKDRSLAHLGRFNQMDIESQYVDGFYPGCRVRHEDYGEGEVVRLETRMRKQYVRIRFREDGERSFALEHVSLYVID